MSKLLVNNSEIFKPRYIKEAILRETDCDEETADKITTSVVSTIYNNYDTSVDRTSIRTLINAQFIKRGMLKEEEQNRKLGLSVRDFEELIHKGCKDNANMLYNPEMIAKYCYDSIAKEDALLKQPKRCREAYEEYYYHCLSGNNNLIVKTNGIVQSMNIVDIIDNLDKQEFFVPSVNPNNSEISWKKITNGKCTGKKEVFEIEFTKGYKIECTSDHKFLKYYTKNNKFCKNYDICIDDFDKFKSYNSIRIGTLNYIPVENDDKYYLKSAVYGFFLGDGYLDNDKIKFHLRKEDKINYIKNILEKLNINYDEYPYQNDVTISCNNFLEIKDKYTFPHFKLNYTGLLEGLINSDGYVTTHGGLNCNYLEFDTTNKFIGDLFFIACLTHNIRPSYQLIERKIENHLNVYRFIVQNNYVYNLLYDINLRDGHKLRLTTQKSNNSVYKTSSIYPKKVTSLGEQLVYNITVEDNHNYLAGTQGFVLTQNCHDLESQELRSNCFNIDIRWIAKNGLDMDGNRTVATSKPAKSLYTLLRHMCEFFMACSCVFSGGLGYPYFNVFLAPYCKGMSYKEIKQSLQMFIFDVNQSLVSRGGQICFTSVGLEFKVPEWLENEPAIAPGGVAIGTYKDYESEAELLLRAYMEIKMEGDSLGRPFRFPNDIFTIRDGVLDEYKGNIKLAHEYIAKFPTPYFLNSTHDERVCMGCRTTNIDNWTGNKEKDLLNTGNFMYTSLNLPLIIMDNKDNWREAIKYYCDVSREYLLYRKEQIEKRLYEDHLLDLLLSKDCETGEQLYDLDRLSYTIGYVGLNEAILTLTDGKDDILSNKELGKEILDIMNEKCDEYKEKDHLRWAVFSSPAESTAYKFGEYNKRKHPDAYVQGTKGNYYLTNSHHIRVSDTSNIIEHIRNGDYFHPQSLGGCIEHLWLGDSYIDPKSLFSLTQKIAKTNMNYWDYDTAFSSCSSCGFSNTEIFSECPICESDDVITYDRCFSGDTFIYIKKGKIVKPVTLKDFVENYNVTDWEVPVFDYKTQSYVWSKVKRGIKNPPEEMINIKFNKGYEVTCTPNHEFYDYRTFSRKQSMYDTIPAKDLNVKSKIINHRCPKFLDDMEENYLGTFIGFVLGDGNVTLQENGKNVFIRLRFYKKEKSDYCKTILDKNNLEYTFSDDNIDKRNNSKIYSYYIGANNIGNKAYDMFNKTHGNKRAIIDECYNQDLFVGILAGLINSDGSVLVESRKNSIVTTFSQVDNDILWLFYNIALLLGTNPSISFTERQGYEPVGRVEITSLKAYEILNNIILRSPFDEALEKGKCISDAKSVNGMCTVSAISEDVMQNSYCIETEHDGHNTLFNGILTRNCTGYYVPVKGFNKGKKQEFKDRYRHSFKKEKANEL